MIGKSNKDHSLLTEQEFEKQKLDLSYKRDEITEQLKDLNKRQDHIINEVRTNLEFCTNLINRFNNGSIEDKREILLNLGRTVDLRDKILSIKPEIPFKSMQKVKKFTTTYPKWVELNPSLDNNKNEALATVSRFWRRGQDSNLRSTKRQKSLFESDAFDHSATSPAIRADISALIAGEKHPA